MSNLIAALALIVSAFGAAWVACQDSGRFRRLERYGAALQYAREGSLEQDALRSVFDRLALPLALEALAPRRRWLLAWSWICLVVGSVFELVWIVFLLERSPQPVTWATYGGGLTFLVGGALMRGGWRELRQRWMRDEMNQRRSQLGPSSTARSR